MFLFFLRHISSPPVCGGGERREHHLSRERASARESTTRERERERHFAAHSDRRGFGVWSACVWLLLLGFPAALLPLYSVQFSCCRVFFAAGVVCTAATTKNKQHHQPTNITTTHRKTETHAHTTISLNQNPHTQHTPPGFLFFFFASSQRLTEKQK